MQGKRAMLLASVGALAALMGGISAQAQSQRQGVPVWADRTGFDEYDWIDRADAISEAIGDAPPDTSFAFDQGEPWAWSMEDGSTLIVEQLNDGPHGYYFEGGSDTPFLVRDPQTSYGFIDGAVAVVYGADSQALGRDKGRDWLGTAMQGFERGRRLKRALAMAGRQRDVNTDRWFGFSGLLYDWWDDWDYGLRRNPAWRRHHDGPRGIEHRRRWEHERQRREVLGGLFQRWGQGGFRGKPPGRFTPPRPGTPPPHRWNGRGNDGPGHDRDRHGMHRPRTGGGPLVQGGPQVDTSVEPMPVPGTAGGPGRGRPGANVPQPLPRPGSPRGGYRPRPEPQVQAPAAGPQPVIVTPAPTPAPAAEQPRPRPGHDWNGGGRPRPVPETSGNDPTPRPIRSERPSYAPPVERSAAPTRSFTPSSGSAPTRSYTPSPSPAPAPTRSYTPSPSPAPSHSSPTPSPSPSRSSPAVSRSKED